MWQDDRAQVCPDLRHHSVEVRGVRAQGVAAYTRLRRMTGSWARRVTHRRATVDRFCRGERARLAWLEHSTHTLKRN